VKRRITCYALLCSIPLFFYATAGGQDRKGNTNQIKEAGSIEAPGEKKVEGAEHKTEPSQQESTVPEDADKAGEPGEVKEPEKPAAGAEKTSEEKVVPPVKKSAGKRKNMEPVREQQEDLLSIDDEGIKNGRIPGISLKSEEGPDNAIVKIPEDKIARKTKDKKKTDGLFGVSTETMAKVGLLLFILIVLIIYKTRTKRKKRKVVRTIHKR
jgi:hypothetical protein